MWIIQSINIKGFWGKYTATANFYDDVNILIGDNGSGKTNFMDILSAVLTADIYKLYESDFSEVKIIIKSHEKKTKTIVIEKNEIDEDVYITYKISRKIFSEFPVFSRHQNRVFTSTWRRRFFHDIKSVQEKLSEYISVSSLSVYRNPSITMFENESRNRLDGVEVFSPVDQRLQSLSDKLSGYQLELSREGEKISEALQKTVLKSFLATKNKQTSRYESGITIKKFDNSIEKENFRRDEINKLKEAYRQLNCNDANFSDHVDAVIAANDYLYSTTKKTEEDTTKKIREDFTHSVRVLEANSIVEKIVKYGLDAKDKKDQLFKPLGILISTLKDFIANKEFYFSPSGSISVRNQSNESIGVEKLSSGEKQLMILLIETILQREKPTIFLADEPELSLHISWQRKILSSVLAINPNAQIVVATHSPEIAGKFPTKLISMSEVLHE